MKKFLALPVLGLVALFSAQSANASLIMGLKVDGIATFVVLDNDINDNLGAANAINWAGTLGDWQTVVGTGLSKNQALPATMDLSYSVSYNGPGAPGPGNTIFIWIIDTFNPNLGHVLGQLDGNQTGTGSVRGDMCLGNLAVSGYQIACSAALTNIGPFATGSYSGNGLFSGPGTAAILQVFLTADSANYIASGDFVMRKVPEPGSLGLLGFALLGFAAIARGKTFVRK